LAVLIAIVLFVATYFKNQIPMTFVAFYSLCLLLSIIATVISAFIFATDVKTELWSAHFNITSDVIAVCGAIAGSHPKSS
jgi:hypothetical protein